MMNDMTMLTAVEVLEQARRLGAPTALQTFWKYIRLGLLPKGRKIRGRGNCSYFPASTPRKLELIHRLSKEVKLAAIVRVVHHMQRKKPGGEPIGILAKSMHELARGDK